MADSWTISVSGRVYGPYSLAQMQSFHAEGRLADHSMIARAGEDQFHAAREDTHLAALFSAPAAPAAAAPVETPKFGLSTNHVSVINGVSEYEKHIYPNT